MTSQVLIGLEKLLVRVIVNFTSKHSALIITKCFGLAAASKLQV